MITTHKKHHGKSIPKATKLAIALKSIKGKQTISAISKEHNVSRTTVYLQQEKALKAANQAFEEKDDDVLFYIPVTKAFLYAMIVALFVICKSSYRDIIFFLKSIFNYHVSLGTVSNVINEAADKAVPINNSYDLSTVRESASDEVFHLNKPLLVTVDIASRFCPLLVHANNRDGTTWGVNLLDLHARGYAPETSIIDGANGMINGYEEALPDTKLRHDHFHFIMALTDCAQFLKNRMDSAKTEAMELFSRSINAKNEDKEKKYTEEFVLAHEEFKHLENIYTAFKTLSSWLQYDVLQLAGKSPAERSMLYDFILSEMISLASKHPHRIDAIVKAMKKRRDALLDITHTLNEKFSVLSVKYKVSIQTIWNICELAKHSFDSPKYVEKADQLASFLGSTYDVIEDEVLLILESTHRCSSMVENFNSRLRPYLDNRKFISPKILALIQFYLNHKPFMRSKHERLVNKSPAEAFTGKSHKPWLEMLGFNCCVTRVAA